MILYYTGIYTKKENNKIGIDNYKEVCMRYIGKSYPIHDAGSKAAGRAVYAGDMELKGMLHMALLFSTIPHGIVKHLDCSKALALPGDRKSVV